MTAEQRPGPPTTLGEVLDAVRGDVGPLADYADQRKLLDLALMYWDRDHQTRTWTVRATHLANYRRGVNHQRGRAQEEWARRLREGLNRWLDRTQTED